MQVKLVLQRNRLFVESPEKKILEKLLDDIDIKAAHEACGNAGIKSGQGRLDTAAAAIATTMQTIDLTKAPEEPKEDEEGREPDATQQKNANGVGQKRPRDDDDDVEAAEAERSLQNNGAAASRTARNGSGNGVEAGQQRRGNGEAAAINGGDGVCDGKPHPVPHSKQSALPPEAESDVQLFSFEISPLHVCSHHP